MDNLLSRIKDLQSGTSRSADATSRIRGFNVILALVSALTSPGTRSEIAISARPTTGDEGVESDNIRFTDSNVEVSMCVFKSPLGGDSDLSIVVRGIRGLQTRQ